MLKNLTIVFVNIAWLGLAVKSSAVTATATASTTTTQSSIAALQVVMGLLVVVAAIFILAWLVKRFAPGNLTGNKQMRVISYLMLSNREKAVLVQVGDKQLLLGVAPGRVSTLCEFDQPVVNLDTETNSGQSFSTQLFQRTKKSNDASDVNHDKTPLSDFSRYLKELLSNGQPK